MDCIFSSNFEEDHITETSNQGHGKPCPYHLVEEDHITETSNQGHGKPCPYHLVEL